MSLEIIIGNNQEAIEIPGRPYALADGTLASQGRTVTTSSTEAAGFEGGLAVDGNTGTRWSSAFADPQWIQVDLGSSRTLTRAELTRVPAGDFGLALDLAAVEVRDQPAGGPEERRLAGPRPTREHDELSGFDPQGDLQKDGFCRPRVGVGQRIDRQRRPASGPFSGLGQSSFHRSARW